MREVKTLPAAPTVYHAAANQKSSQSKSSLCSIHINHAATDAGECLLDTTNPGCQSQLHGKTGTLHQRE